jgi:NAD(P)-dependent dehydrogenase (short-subunit alcohol dehydrogenase family)
MNNGALADKVVLVTGGASGLGRAVVDRVLAAGGRPLVLDLKPPATDVPYAAVDLVDGRAAERAVDDLATQAGGLDAVVTAAGIDVPGRLDTVTAADWERVVQVNLLGTAAVARAALPHLARRRGHLVTVASTLGLRAVSDATAYCAAKFGVVGFTRALAAELGDTVTVTLLIPGGMQTSFFDGRDEQYRPGPEARLCDPAQVADAALFAITAPPGACVRELVVTPPVESSYP